MLPQMKLSYIPQTGHLTLSVLGSVGDRILLSSTLGSTPHRGHALNSTSLKITVLSHLVCDRTVEAHRDSPLTPKMSARMSPGVATNGSALIGSYSTSR